MKEIADYFAISAPSATSMVETLIKSNHLRRKPDSKDRRIIRVALTANGKKEFAKVLQNAKTKLGEFLTKLKPEDLARLTKVLVQLNKHLNE